MLDTYQILLGYQCLDGRKRVKLKIDLKETEYRIRMSVDLVYETIEAFGNTVMNPTEEENF
jgi:hypothetical protein